MWSWVMVLVFPKICSNRTESLSTVEGGHSVKMKILGIWCRGDYIVGGNTAWWCLCLQRSW